MLEKVSTDEVSSYQSYTVRQLNSKQSSLPDSEHYKLVEVKEDALSNKQYIGKSSLAIAQYVTGYVTKAERSKMQDLWQEVSSHSSVYSKLWSFGVCSLRSRECGMYEASDILLGDHLCEKSQTIKWIDVSQAQHRRRRLLNHSKLVEMREKNPDSTDIFGDNLIDTHYPQRPDDLEDVCLYNFVAEYKKAGVDDDGNSVYCMFTKPILPNHKMFDLAKENERESYFYSLLLLFVPFCNKADLVEKRETARVPSIVTWHKIIH